MENWHQELLRQKYLDQAAKFLEESRKLHDYVPDYDQSPEKMVQWYAVPEHKIHYKNQIQYLNLLYEDMMETWKELSSLPRSKKRQRQSNDQ